MPGVTVFSLAIDGHIMSPSGTGSGCGQEHCLLLSIGEFLSEAIGSC